MWVEPKERINVNKQNTYGCTPLHLSLKTAINEARSTAQGESTQDRLWVHGLVTQ